MRRWARTSLLAVALMITLLAFVGAVWRWSQPIEIPLERYDRTLRQIEQRLRELEMSAGEIEAALEQFKRDYRPGETDGHRSKEGQQGRR